MYYVSFTTRCYFWTNVMCDMQKWKCWNSSSFFYFLLGEGGVRSQRTHGHVMWTCVSVSVCMCITLGCSSNLPSRFLRQTRVNVDCPLVVSVDQGIRLWYRRVWACVTPAVILEKNWDAGLDPTMWRLQKEVAMESVDRLFVGYNLSPILFKPTSAHI